MVAANTSGGKKKHPYRTQAKKDAHKAGAPRPKDPLKPKVYSADNQGPDSDIRTTFGKLKHKDNGRLGPRSPVILQKGKFDKIDGTRIQNIKGGCPVRVVIEDGKKFPPGSTHSCKQWLRKLEKARKEAEEIAIMRGDKLPGPPKADAAPPRKKERPAVKRKAAQAEIPEAPPTKKERKAQQHEAKQGKLEQLRQEQLAVGERKLLAEGFVSAEVVTRAKGLAWVRIAASSEQPLCAEVAEAIRGAKAIDTQSAEAASGDLLPLWFFDAEQGLNLQPGAKLSVRLYRDPRGVGACEAKSCAIVEAGSTAATGEEKATAI